MTPSPGADAKQRLRLAVLDDYQRVARGLVDWDAVLPGIETVFFHEHVSDAERLVGALRPFEIVIAMRERTAFPRPVLEQLPNLRLLVTTGARNAAIDVAAAEENGIVVCGTRSMPWGVAELTWGLILSLARRIPTEDASIRNGGWQTSVGIELHGRTLGVVGFGRVGQRVAQIGAAMGMHVAVWSEHATEADVAGIGAELATKAELFQRSDVVTLHLVLSERSQGTVGREELRAMRPTALLVNTSRGPIVDQAALLEALEQEQIAGVALDVYDDEPLPPDHPLRRSDRTVLTPHIGYVTYDNYRLLYADAVEDIQAFLTGSALRQLTPDAR